MKKITLEEIEKRLYCDVRYSPLLLVELKAKGYRWESGREISNYRVCCFSENSVIGVYSGTKKIDHFISHSHFPIFEPSMVCCYCGQEVLKIIYALGVPIRYCPICGRES